MQALRPWTAQLQHKVISELVLQCLAICVERQALFQLHYFLPFFLPAPLTLSEPKCQRRECAHPLLGEPNISFQVLALRRMQTREDKRVTSFRSTVVPTLLLDDVCAEQIKSACSIVKSQRCCLLLVRKHCTRDSMHELHFEQE